MTAAVVTGALTVAALNALCAAIGCWRWLRRRPGRDFWLLLRAAQAAVIVYVAAVGVLAAESHYPREHLFYLYALLPVAVAFMAEQYRAVAAQSILDQRGLEGAAAVGALPQSQQHEVVGAILRRELGVMTLSALVVAFLALRAASTAHGF